MVLLHSTTHSERTSVQRPERMLKNRGIEVVRHFRHSSCGIPMGNSGVRGDC